MSLAATTRTPLIPRHNGRDSSPLRRPSLTGKSHIWITLIVIIPTIFAVIVCVITACIYRYRKKRTAENTLNISMTSIDQETTRVHHPQPNVYAMEELPPSYDLLSSTKKDFSFIAATNLNNELHPSPVTITDPLYYISSDQQNPSKP